MHTVFLGDDFFDNMEAEAGSLLGRGVKPRVLEKKKWCSTLPLLGLLAMFGGMVLLERQEPEVTARLGTVPKSLKESPLEEEKVLKKEDSFESSAGIFSGTRARVLDTDCSALMPLFAVVEFSGLSGPVAVRYAPLAGSKLPALWVSTMEAGESRQRGSLTLSRLRAKTIYGAEVFSEEGTLVSSLKFETCETGWERVDNGEPWALVSGEPSWETLSTVGYAWKEGNEKTVTGLIAFDAEGFVVWIFHQESLEAWDFLKSGDLVLECEGQGNKDVAASDSKPRRNSTEDDDDTLMWKVNSQMKQIDWLGSPKAQFVSSCAGHPLNGNAISHECRVDDFSDDEEVLTVRMKGKKIPGTTLAMKSSATAYSNLTADFWFGSNVVKWNRHSEKVEVIYDMFDFADPRTSMFPNFWSFFTSECSPLETENDDNSKQLPSGGENWDPPAITGVEYFHVSSISVSPLNGNYIVASRDLSTIWSLRRDGSGPDWSLSAEPSLLNSTLSYEKPIDAAYMPHDVQQLVNGDLAVLDDGTNRPGCDMRNPKFCFSRAIVYRLDLENKTASVRWQFEWPTDFNQGYNWTTVATNDLYNSCGGSLRQLSKRTTSREDDTSPNYLVSFTSMSFAHGGSPENDANETIRSAYAFEIDPKGSTSTEEKRPLVTSAIVMPVEADQVGAQQGYRVIPWDSINEEASSPPDWLLL